MQLHPIARFLISLGVFAVIAGLLFQFFPGLFTKMPGDIRIQRPGYTISIPVASCLVISIVLSVIMRILRG